MKTINFFERKKPMRTWNVNLQRISFDQDTQPRAAIDKEFTEELVNELKDGCFRQWWFFMIAKTFGLLRSKTGMTAVVLDIETILESR